MPTLKQKTIDGETYQLKRYKSSRPNKQYEYYITAEGFTENGQDRRYGDETYYTRDRAMKEWQNHIRTVRRGAAEERNDARGPSLPGFNAGGGGASLPGFGFDDEEDDDDEGGFYLPGF